MFEGPTSSRRRSSQQNVEPEKPPKKQVKSAGKTVVNYSDYLQRYIDHDQSVKTSLIPPKASAKLLQELSIEAVVKNPEIIKSCLPDSAPVQVLEAGAALLFTPELKEKDWKEQLEVLKKYGAEICDIDVSRFEHVDVVDLSTIQPDEVERFIGRESNELIVVHGTCIRATHLPISKGVTVIGQNAMVTVGDKSFRLHTPTAKITANSQVMNYKPDTWQIAKNATEINTDSKKFQAGHFPLVYLNQSSLIGVELDCQNVTQGIVGSKGNIYIANNKITNTRECGIFVHDCESAAIFGNDLYTREANDKIGVNSASCKICRQTDNSVSFA